MKEWLKNFLGSDAPFRKKLVVVLLLLVSAVGVSIGYILVQSCTSTGHIEWDMETSKNGNKRGRNGS